MTTASLRTLDRSKPILDDDQILAKAIARFNRDRRNAGLPQCQLSIHLSEVVQNIVTVRNVNGDLAMYEVTPSARLRQVHPVRC